MNKWLQNTKENVSNFAKKNWKKGVLTATVLTGLVSGAYGLENRIKHENSNVACWDGYVATVLSNNGDEVPLKLDGSNKNFETGFYADEGKLVYQVINVKDGIEKIVIPRFSHELNSKDALTKSKAEKRKIHYLKKAQNSKIGTSDKYLEYALKDGIITPQEKKNISDGEYLLIVKSPETSKRKANSLFAILDVDKNDDYKINKIPQKPVKPEVKKRFSLTLDGIVGKDSFGGRVGLGYGPVSVTGSYSQKKDEVVNEFCEPLSVGRTGTGIEENTDYKSIGVGLEVALGKSVFVGGEYIQNQYTNKINEKIISENNEILKEDNYSKKVKENSFNSYLGGSIPLSKNAKLRGFVGYDTKKGVNGGAGIKVYLGSRHKGRR
jgi:hypothetical protein